MPVGEIVALSGLALKTLELVHQSRTGKLGAKEAQALYCRITSSLLYEVHSNVQRCAYLVKSGHQGKYSVGVFAFLVRDALFADFCRMCPEPLMISKLNEIYSGFARIQHWQGYPETDESETYVLGFANDFFEKKLDANYNDIRDALNALSDDVQVPPRWPGLSTPE
ncbi:MAG: hypothetical protein KC503_34060 [Myxococcales bacterium]|nr:hypothetical protein [Myxococcales bacterium]